MIDSATHGTGPIGKSIDSVHELGQSLLLRGQRTLLLKTVTRIVDRIQTGEACRGSAICLLNVRLKDDRSPTINQT
jgi:hypothetical protein